tara:strand:+ start:111 stop:506 length:396 start_codon:yes stop_codon:yes gene_type:complete
MKTYQQLINEFKLKDWYNKGRNVRIPNEDQASFKTLRQDDRAQQGKFIKQASKGKDPSKLTDDDFEGGALPRNMSQLKDFMQGKGGATWSFTRGMKTGPTALTRQTIERPLKAIGNIAKKIRGKGQLYSKK